jgi:hypothetical protein
MGTCCRGVIRYLWGDHDNFATPQQAEKLCALTPGAAIERLADAGHLPWLDDPAGVARRTADFLAADECGTRESRGCHKDAEGGDESGGEVVLE